MALHESTPLLFDKMEVARPSFTSARTIFNGKKRPQAIAHRGYKSAFPENTMGAFRGAVEVGAHAIETDIHLSKDGVVVISHDPDLKRCFGKEEKIIDCNWSYLETLRTLKEPQQSMPRLKDLLKYLNEPGLEDIWILLDIKMDNNSDDVIRLIASTLEEVKPSPKKAWADRVLLGIWSTQYLPLCAKYLPDYPMVHIGFSISYARKFLRVPNVQFNMLQQIMVGPCGSRFLKDIRNAGRSLFLWTVNEEKTMKWCISKGVDGVITDDPKKYLEVLKNYNGEKVRLSIRVLANVLWINVLATILAPWIRRRFEKQAKKERQCDSVETPRIEI